MLKKLQGLNLSNKFVNTTHVISQNDGEQLEAEPGHFGSRKTATVTNSTKNVQSALSSTAMNNRGEAPS